MLVKFLKTLFSSSKQENEKTAEPTAIEYQGFTIIAEPRQYNGQWQVSGRIERLDGDTKNVHSFIRADTLHDEAAAADEMFRKAKLMIDQLGEKIFDK